MRRPLDPPRCSARAALAFLTVGGFFHSWSSAQTTLESAPPADSAAQLTSKLSGETRATATLYLKGELDPATALTTLATDPAATPFISRVLPTEPVAVRRRFIDVLDSWMRKSQDGRWLDREDLANVFLDRVRQEHDPMLVRDALEALEVLRMQPARITTRAAIAQRIRSARAANDTALLDVLLDEDENIWHNSAGVYAPSFVRTPPPVFNVAPAGTPIRVLVFGDFGSEQATSHQQLVADAMATYHARTPFTFGLTTGDNFYPTAFPTPSDPLWKERWEAPYDRLQIPIYASLGNHDWWERAGPIAQYVYGLHSRSWKFPAYYYTYTAGDAQFFAINTDARTPRHLEWLRRELAASKATWKIVYGHYPMHYWPRPETSLVPLLREHGVDLYVAGHDHSLQHWQKDGIDYVISAGGGAPNMFDLSKMSPDAKGREYTSTEPGFADLRIDGNAMHLRFVGYDRRVGANPAAVWLEPKILYEFSRRK